MSNITAYVLGFAFNWDHTEIVLIRKRRPGWQAGLMNGVGGKIQEGEAPIEAMNREFQEETGCDVPTEQWRYFARMTGEDFSVDVYETSLSLAQWIQIISMTDEPIFKIQVDAVRNYPRIENIDPLISLALLQRPLHTHFQY